MDDSVSSSGEEDLRTALQHISADTAAVAELGTAPQPRDEVSGDFSSLTLQTLRQETREEVVEDFVRNFLVTAGLHKTADVFQAEW